MFREKTMIRTQMSLLLAGAMTVAAFMLPGLADARLFPRTTFVEKFGYDT